MFDLGASQRRARARLGRASTRRRRSDAGRFRLPPLVLNELRPLVLGPERPPMAAIQRRIADVCAKRGLRAPSRASLYNVLARIEGHRYNVPALPPHVREALAIWHPTRRCRGISSCSTASIRIGGCGRLRRGCLAQPVQACIFYWRPRSRGLLQAAARASDCMSAPTCPSVIPPVRAWSTTFPTGS